MTVTDRHGSAGSSGPPGGGSGPGLPSHVRRRTRGAGASAEAGTPLTCGARLYTHQDPNGTEATEAAVRDLLTKCEFFWLDVVQPDDPAVAPLIDLLRLPADSRQFLQSFGRRPTIVRTERHAWFALYAAAAHGKLVEIHAVTADGFLVSARPQPCEAVDLVLGAGEPDYLPRHQRADLVAEALHRLSEAVADTYAGVLDEIDDDIDRLEVEIIQHPSNEHLQELFSMQRDIISMRRVVIPQRDVFGRLSGEIVAIPHQDAVGTTLFRLTYDRFVRLSDLLDSYRDLVSGALDMHLSTVSNRLGEVTTQLTIIATVFLPLTYLTGFFGQNFGFLLKGIVPTWTFVVFGVGLELAAIVFLFVFFRRRGWVGSTRFSRGRREPAGTTGAAGARA